ncbi:hypothetical protein M413DRAFT_348701 [Hebeloma cylindrosporum]|uniref:Uncharacterized protein n=1 Tax=Hebeloma cylindrosporum TaxID=76867 RepID=A0A0C2Y2Y1_HEBCY|nr:hypothetical protein M413DRAFT_348701 [Hebeloma cylindrosporum h7]
MELPGTISISLPYPIIFNCTKLSGLSSPSTRAFSVSSTCNLPIQSMIQLCAPLSRRHRSHNYYIGLSHIPQCLRSCNHVNRKHPWTLSISARFVFRKATQIGHTSRSTPSLSSCLALIIHPPLTFPCSLHFRSRSSLPPLFSCQAIGIELLPLKRHEW